jgi:hypothetical protein
MPFSLFALVSWVLLFTAFPASVHAQNCGDPPPVQNETLEGEIQGKAQFLSRFLGDASLGGRIQTARTEIFSKYPEGERSNAYFEYQVCVMLMNDQSLTTLQKLDKLTEIRREFSRPVASSSATVGDSGIANTGKINVGGDVKINEPPSKSQP